MIPNKLDKIDVLQVMPDFAFGGAERMVENLSIELHKRGIRILVASMFDRHTPITQELEDEGIEVVYLGKRRGPDLSMPVRLRRLVRAACPKVVHSHRYCQQYLLPARIGLAPSIKWVHTIHSVASKEVPPRIQRMQKFAFSRGAVVPIAINETTRSTICELYELRENQVPMVYNGIPDYAPKKVEDFPGDVGSFCFLAVGREEPSKNHVALVRAFVSFHSHCPKTKLLIIGEGGLFSEVTAEIKRLDASSYIFQLGSKSNARDYYYAADSFVLPSLYEGMPMTLIEAMMAGLPVLASNRGGTVDMIDDGKTGYLCDPDENSIIEGLMRLYSDPFRSKVALAGMGASRHYTAPAMADGYEEVYAL